MSMHRVNNMEHRLLDGWPAAFIEYMNRVLSMRAGQVVEKVEESGNWYRVRYNGEFWMYKNYLKEV